MYGVWQGVDAMFRGIIRVDCGVFAVAVVSFFVLGFMCVVVSFIFIFAFGVGFGFLRWFCVRV